MGVTRPGRGLTRREFILAGAGAGAGMLLLGGCGSGGEQASGEVRAWGWDIAAASLKEVVPMFKKDSPDVSVKVEDVGRLDLYERATTGLAAGGVGLPDVFMLESDRLSGYITQFPEGLLNLSEQGVDEYKRRIAGTKWPQAELDGQIYAMPWDLGPTGLFYRVDFFEEAGVNAQDVATWEDLIAAGEEIRGATDARILSLSTSDDDGLFRMMLNQQGSYYFDEGGRITINSPEAVRALGLIKQMFDADLIANVKGYEGGVTAVVNEQVATVPAGVWYSGTLTSQAPDQEGNWDAVLLPAVEGGGNRAANLGGSNLVINANSENPEAAYAYATYAMGNTEAQMYMMETYGLFPSLLKTYEDPFFDKNVPYFNDKPIYRMFADQVPDIPDAYYTEDYARALERSVDAQSQVLLDGGDPEEALTQAAEQLAQETDREIA